METHWHHTTLKSDLMKVQLQALSEDNILKGLLLGFFFSPEEAEAANQ